MKGFGALAKAIAKDVKKQDNGLLQAADALGQIGAALGPQGGDAGRAGQVIGAIAAAAKPAIGIAALVAKINDKEYFGSIRLLAGEPVAEVHADVCVEFLCLCPSRLQLDEAELQCFDVLPGDPRMGGAKELILDKILPTLGCGAGANALATLLERKVASVLVEGETKISGALNKLLERLENVVLPLAIQQGRTVVTNQLLVKSLPRVGPWIIRKSSSIEAARLSSACVALLRSATFRHIEQGGAREFLNAASMDAIPPSIFATPWARVPLVAPRPAVAFLGGCLLFVFYLSGAIGRVILFLLGVNQFLDYSVCQVVAAARRSQYDFERAQEMEPWTMETRSPDVLRKSKRRQSVSVSQGCVFVQFAPQDVEAIVAELGSLTRLHLQPFLPMLLLTIVVAFGSRFLLLTSFEVAFGSGVLASILVLITCAARPTLKATLCEIALHVTALLVLVVDKVIPDLGVKTDGLHRISAAAHLSPSALFAMIPKQSSNNPLLHDGAQNSLRFVKALNIPLPGLQVQLPMKESNVFHADTAKGGGVLCVGGARVEIDADGTVAQDVWLTSEAKGEVGVCRGMHLTTVTGRECGQLPWTRAARVGVQKVVALGFKEQTLLGVPGKAFPAILDPIEVECALMLDLTPSGRQFSIAIPVAALTSKLNTLTKAVKSAPLLEVLKTQEEDEMDAQVLSSLNLQELTASVCWTAANRARFEVGTTTQLTYFQ